LLGLKNLGPQVLHFAWKNIKIRYRGTYLGLLWAVAEPLLFFLFLYILFSSLKFGVKEDFGIYLLIGIVLYHAFARGTQRGLGCLRENNGILSSINIRREFFPVTSTVTSAILLMVELVAFFALIPVFQFGLDWTILLLPIVLALLLLLVLGFSYLLSIIFVFVKDIQPLWSVLVHALLFLTPVFWYLEDAGGIALELQKINPLGQLIELAHKLVFGQIPPINDWVYATGMVFGILFIGYALFQKYQEKVVEEL